MLHHTTSENSEKKTSFVSLKKNGHRKRLLDNMLYINGQLRSGNRLFIKKSRFECRHNRNDCRRYISCCHAFFNFLIFCLLLSLVGSIRTALFFVSIVCRLRAVAQCVLVHKIACLQKMEFLQTVADIPTADHQKCGRPRDRSKPDGANCTPGTFQPAIASRTMIYCFDNYFWQCIWLSDYFRVL